MRCSHVYGWRGRSSKSSSSSSKSSSSSRWRRSRRGPAGRPPRRRTRARPALRRRAGRARCRTARARSAPRRPVRVLLPAPGRRRASALRTSRAGPSAVLRAGSSPAPTARVLPTGWTATRRAARREPVPARAAAAATAPAAAPGPAERGPAARTAACPTTRRLPGGRAGAGTGPAGALATDGLRRGAALAAASRRAPATATTRRPARPDRTARRCADPTAPERPRRVPGARWRDCSGRRLRGADVAGDVGAAGRAAGGVAAAGTLGRRRRGRSRGALRTVPGAAAAVRSDGWAGGRRPAAAPTTRAVPEPAGAGRELVGSSDVSRMDRRDRLASDAVPRGGVSSAPLGPRIARRETGAESGRAGAGVAGGAAGPGSGATPWTSPVSGLRWSSRRRRRSPGSLMTDLDTTCAWRCTGRPRRGRDTRLAARRVHVRGRRSRRSPGRGPPGRAHDHRGARRPTVRARGG